MYKLVMSRAARYIACDSHVHLISKDGSVISRKSPSPVSDGAACNTQSRRLAAISRSLSHAIELVRQCWNFIVM